jgi:hypothetical protein
MEPIPSGLSLRKCSSAFFESEEFYRENSQFFSFGPSQTAVRMIVNIVNNEKIPPELLNLQLQQIALQIMQETALNELQITIWSIFIENFVWNEKQKPIRTVLIYAALRAKEYLGEKVEFFIIKYSEKDTYFRIHYQRWIADKLFEVSLKDLNIQYQKLSKGKGIKVNYSFVVDDILLHYQPYNRPVLAPIQEAEALTETHENEIFPANLMPLDSETPDILDYSELIPPLLVHNTSKSLTSNDFTVSIFLATNSWAPDRPNN